MNNKIELLKYVPDKDVIEILNKDLKNDFN